MACDVHGEASRCKTGIQPAVASVLMAKSSCAAEKGDKILTQFDEERFLPRLLAACVIGLLIMVACMFHYLPRQFAMIAISWAMLSISVGISFGHAVLNEQ